MIRSALAAVFLAAAAPLAAQTIAITGGTVALGDGSEPIPGGTVVIRDGRIVGAGANFPIPRGAEMVDARGKWVTPGIIAGFSRLGLSEVDLSAQGSDDRSARAGPFSAAIDVAPAVTRSIPPSRQSRRWRPPAPSSPRLRPRNSRRQGAVITSAPTWTRLPLAAASSSSSLAKPAPARPADRARRRMCCSATRCARRPNCSALRLPCLRAPATTFATWIRSSAIPTSRG